MCTPSPIRLSWCSGVMGWRVGNQTPECGGRLTPVVWTGEHRRPRVKAIGSKTAARQGEATRPAAQPRQSRRKRRHHDHEARGITPLTPPDPSPFEAEQRNHSRRRHLLDRIMSRCDRHSECRGGYLGPVGDAGGTVTPAISTSTNTGGKRVHHVL